MTVSNEQMQLLHERLLQMMQEIHQICVTNGIKYTLMGGSLIGAVRHKGFIPWDDDFDIGLEWSSYKKFVEVVFNQNHDWLEFTLAGKTEEFGSVIIRVYDSKSTLIGKYGIEKGASIDIFPISYAGNTKFTAKLNYYRVRMLMAPIERKFQRFYDKNVVKEFILNQLSDRLNIHYLMEKFNSIYDKLNKKPTKYSADFTGTLAGIVLSEYFDEYELCDFENQQFFKMKKSHEYLTSVFGDYMQLPPKSDRIPKHLIYLNMDLPYREYLKQK